MSIANKYIEGLKKAYYDNGAGKEWEDFERVVHGVNKEDIQKLHELYNDIPDSLLDYLSLQMVHIGESMRGRKLLFTFWVLTLKSIHITCYPQNK